jgi:hypothetical protein
MLKAGTLGNFSDSMAAAIEEEFEKLWECCHETDLPAETRDDRRMLFISISQGVIKYLRQKAAEAFEVTVKVEQIHAGNLVESKGKTTSTGPGTIETHEHDVVVNQSEDNDNPSYNKVKSEGVGTVKILMEELDS